MRCAFAGTDKIGEIALTALLESRHEVAAVISQPDRPKGRGQKIEEGEVARICKNKGIRLLQPESIKDESVIECFKETSPDILVVVSYGQYIPRAVYEWPQFHAINLHPSFLPRWRGASPTRYPLIYGDEMTGVTIQYVHKKMDSGDIVLQEAVPISPDDTHDTLIEKLYPIGANLLIKAVNLIEYGNAQPRAQDESQATWAPKISPDDLWLNFSDTARDVVNRIRAFSSTPGARCRFRERDFRILFAKVTDLIGDNADKGVIIETDKGSLAVQCGDYAISIETIQPSGRNPMSVRDFMNGYRPLTGEKFFGRELGRDETK